MYVCLCVCMYVCVCACMCVYKHIRTEIHIIMPLLVHPVFYMYMIVVLSRIYYSHVLTRLRYYDSRGPVSPVAQCTSVIKRGTSCDWGY